MRKFFFVLLGVISGCFIARSQSSVFTEKAQYRHASVSIAVIDCETGVLCTSYNPHTSLTPASVLKTVTTASAWKILGPDYRFKTQLCAAHAPENGVLKGDLVIKGYGDPTLGSEYFPHCVSFLTNWVKAVKQAGIHTIEGDVVADISAWYDEPLPTRWIWEDIGNYYGAGAWPVSCYDNKYTVYFHPAKVGAKARVARVEPAIVGLSFEVQATGAANNKDSAYIYGDYTGFQKIIRGTIPANKMDFSVKGATPNPPLTLAMLLTNKLKENGIVCRGKNRVSQLPNSTAFVIAAFESPRLEEIVRVTNFKSVNMYAEHLLRAIGTPKQNSYTVSVAKMKAYWQKSGVEPSGAFIYDGSGLSPSNKVSSFYIASVLSRVSNDHYISTIPKAGSEGTVKNMLVGYAGAGVRLKSGSMDAVRCYAGYLIKHDKKFAIAIMINNFTGDSKAVVLDVENYIKGVVAEL